MRGAFEHPRGARHVAREAVEHHQHVATRREGVGEARDGVGVVEADREHPAEREQHGVFVVGEGELAPEGRAHLAEGHLRVGGVGDHLDEAQREARLSGALRSDEGHQPVAVREGGVQGFEVVLAPDELALLRRDVGLHEARVAWVGRRQAVDPLPLAQRNESPTEIVVVHWRKSLSVMGTRVGVPAAAGCVVGRPASTGGVLKNDGAARSMPNSAVTDTMRH